MAIHILVVDNDDQLREMLQQDLEAAGFTVSLAADGDEALRLADDYPPDLAVVNLVLARMSGLEVCRRLWASNATLPVIPLLALDTSAKDYLVQPVTSEEVLAHVRARLSRREHDTARQLKCADLWLDTAIREAWRGERVITLTTTEYHLLRLFMENPRQVLTRDFLYERIWGHDFEGESKVLDVYVHYLRRKLEAAGEKRLLYTVRGAGYVLRGDA